MQNEKLLPSFITIFGGSGDLYNLFLNESLPKAFKIICTGQQDVPQDMFKQKLLEGINKFSRTGKAEKEPWENFAKNIYYKQANFTEPDCYKTLKEDINTFEQEHKQATKVFYLAVNPQFFGKIATYLGNEGFAADRANTRLVIEKPFGTNASTAQELNQLLLSIFEEKQLFRIDHYLGKETVQNMLAFRFANAMFEPIWNSNYIDHIQISVSEKIGVEDRGGYYEHSGALRDMIQNHVMQLLCLVAMEPPLKFEANEVRNKKVDVLHAVRTIGDKEVNTFAVRGQYGEGKIDDDFLKGYRQEGKVNAKSNTETFAALKLFIDNWRWSNVPFYLRSGKRMAETMSIITIQFKAVPHKSFEQVTDANWQSNKIIINLQPEMGIRIRFQAKVPGLEMQLKPVDMTFNYKKDLALPIPEGYETLLLDVLQGDATLFMRADQVEAAWKVVTPILENWEKNIETNFPNYDAGTDGPIAGKKLTNSSNDYWEMIGIEKK
jgi:glucose-6-phosphate 1-dehydrogenase